MNDRSFFQTPISEIKLEDIKLLVDNKIPESQILDYKRDNYTDSGELAKDISAFANTNGGYLILGVSEEIKNKKPTGIPREIVGIQEDPNLVKRLCDMIINSVSPQPHVNFSKLIDVQDKDERLSLVIHVPKSFDSLHMVTVKGKHQFRYYKRYHDQNIPMDEYEVRTRYEMIGRGQNYTDDRLNEVSNQTRRRLAHPESGTLVVSIAPVTTSQKFDNPDYARIFDDHIKYRHPWIRYSGLLNTDLRMDCFEKINSKNNPLAVNRLYYDGPACYATTYIYGDGKHGRVILTEYVVYEAFHMLGIFFDYFMQYQYIGYARLGMEITNLTGARLSYPDIQKHSNIESMPIFDRELPALLRTIDIPNSCNSRKEIIDDFVLPLFREGGFETTINCWNENGDPICNRNL